MAPQSELQMFLFNAIMYAVQDVTIWIVIIVLIIDEFRVRQRCVLQRSFYFVVPRGTNEEWHPVLEKLP
jgi:hypothetical protein